MLDVTDAVLTGDANQCNKKVAQGILDAGAGYVLCLKPNREAMYRAVDGAFARLNVNEFPEVKVRHHREGWAIDAAHVPELASKLPGVQQGTGIGLGYSWKRRKDTRTVPGAPGGGRTRTWIRRRAPFTPRSSRRERLW